MKIQSAMSAALAACSGLAFGAEPTPNLTTNPGFLDTDSDATTGDGWGEFGAALVSLDFFGDGNPGHATLFADNVANTGGIFQAGIPASEGVDYEMTFKIQWESNWEADTFYAIEFFAADDATKLGEAVFEISEDEDFAGTGYRRYDAVATAPAGTAFVRPLIRFENVQSGGASRAATVDNVLVREADDVLNLNPSFGDLVGNGANGDQWGTFGAAALDLDFFNNGNPGHATLFADNIGNSGGIFQLGTPAIAGESYTLTVDIAVEENYDAQTFVAIEFYGDDDGFLIGEVAEEISVTPGAGYVTYTLEGEAPASFTRFARPVVRFENALTSGPGRAATVDNAVLQLTSTVNQGCNEADVAEPFGTLNFFDVASYIGLFNAGDPGADLAAPFGTLNFFDISAFIGIFNAGCP